MNGEIKLVAKNETMAAVHMRLADALEACEEPENEDVVTAVLAGLLAPPRLSSKAASRGYENLLAEHDFAEIEAYQLLSWVGH